MNSVIVLPDLHVPDHDKRSWEAVLNYVSDTRPHVEIVQLGDLMNFESISHHTEKNLRKVGEKTIQKEYAAGNKLLDELQSATNRDTKITLIEGNHDFWVERYVDAHPQLRGFMEVENALRLKDRGINWIRYWRDGKVHTIGKAAYIHGVYTNEHHAKRHAQAYGQNIFYGHTHDIQTFSCTHQGDHKTYVGQSLGCLCKYKQDYIHGKPTKWQQAFGHFFFNPINGTFQYYVIRVINNRFIGPNGREYRG